MILSDELQEFRAEVRDFAQKEIAPGAEEIDQTKEFPAEKVKKLAQRGFLGIMIPREYGGLGLSSMHYLIVMEELSAVCGSTALTYAAHNSLCLNPIFNFGNKAQIEKYVPTLASGEILGAFGLTEPEAGSDAGGTKTNFSENGSNFVLNGSKCFITNGSVGGVLIVTARRTDATQPKDISSFIVESKWPGFSVGKREDKMGLRASDTALLHFEDMKIPKDNLLGQEGEGFKQFLKILDAGRIGIGAMSVGMAQAAFDLALKFAKERKQFNHPIADFQAIQWKLADMATKIEASRNLVYQAAYLKDGGRPYTKEAAMAKLFSSETGREAIYQAMQILGGYGYMSSRPLERMFRDQKLCEIGEGTSEIQRIVIARHLLGKLKT
ncbi:MAG: acyl-CoA dehydrogenase [candidate division Zixibacteria bacterium RBG_16_50_21]|nr:MAG: acyl-CoA dehydrogenase [candidate division Zixibacteria bacterium RBG_16_50_21]